MYERFTDRARRVMQLANAQAKRLNCEFIDAEHVLLGLLEEGSGVASNVLKGMKIDVQRIRLEVEKRIDPKPILSEPPPRIPQTQRNSLGARRCWLRFFKKPNTAHRPRLLRHHQSRHVEHVQFCVTPRPPAPARAKTPASTERQ